MSFTDDVNDFVTNVGEANEDIIKGTVIALYRDIILASPVDTGRFRGNWFVAGANPAKNLTRRKDKSGQGTIKRMQAKVLNSKEFDAFTLTNNLPYSEVIEFGRFKRGGIRGTGSKVNHAGFSKQAPKGVVRVNVIRFDALLAKQARKAKYGSI